jgi:hypothetical protein
MGTIFVVWQAYQFLPDFGVAIDPALERGRSTVGARPGARMVITLKNYVVTNDRTDLRF